MSTADVRWQTRRPLLAVLLVSVVLRVALALFGGQFFWPDESRYIASRQIIQAVSAHDWGSIFRQFDIAEHMLFKVIGLLPAGIEFASGKWDPRVPAILFGLFSVLSIWLLGRIALRLGASESEA